MAARGEVIARRAGEVSARRGLARATPLRGSRILVGCESGEQDPDDIDARSIGERIGVSAASAACLRGGVVQAAVFDLSPVVLP
jgi:hypothetical protein